MTWYKTKMSRYCFKPYMEEYIFVIHSHEQYECDDSSLWTALYDHPAYTQSYPIWSDWLAGETISISEEEAFDFLERKNAFDYWGVQKYWLAEKLKVLLLESQVQSLQLFEEKLALLQYVEAVLNIPFSDKQQPFREKMLSLFQKEREEFDAKIQEEDKKCIQTKELFIRFFSFECTDEEQRLIDEFWWHQSNAPGEQEKRENILGDLRVNHKIIRAKIEENGREVERWIRIQ